LKAPLRKEKRRWGTGGGRWRELWYAPMRVHLTPGESSAKAITAVYY